MQVIEDRVQGVGCDLCERNIPHCHVGAGVTQEALERLRGVENQPPNEAMPDQEPPSSNEGVIQVLRDLISDLEKADRVNHCTVEASIGTVEGLPSGGFETHDWNGQKSARIGVRYQMALPLRP